MRQFILLPAVVLLSVVTLNGCGSSQPAVIEQTISQEELDKQNASYEAEMEEAAKDGGASEY